MRRAPDPALDSRSKKYPGDVAADAGGTPESQPPFRQAQRIKSRCRNWRAAPRWRGAHALVVRQLRSKSKTGTRLLRWRGRTALQARTHCNRHRKPRISGSLHRLIGDFEAEDLFFGLVKFDGGVTHGVDLFVCPWRRRSAGGIVRLSPRRVALLTLLEACLLDCGPMSRSQSARPAPSDGLRPLIRRRRGACRRARSAGRPGTELQSCRPTTLSVDRHVAR